MPGSMRAQQRRRNGATVLLLASVAAGMAGLSFASVPLYRLFCRATGLGGATQRATTAPAEAAGAVVTIRFDAETALFAKLAARFPEGGAKTDLGCWHRFEIENPQTFAAMYQFWVQKR